MLSLVFPNVFRIAREALENACEGIGFARVSGANLMCCSCGDYSNAAIHSTFYVIFSPFRISRVMIFNNKQKD